MVGIGLLGLGTVGSSVASILEQRSSELAQACGAPVVITAAGVRRTGVERPLPESLITTDLEDLIHNPDVDIVVEVMGGLDPAGQLVREALALGKPVVTANKELLAKEWGILWEAQRAGGAPLEFEAAVAGGIPIIRLLRGQLAGVEITAIEGILNGTTNYILTKMKQEGAAFADVLAEAQALGYAEADPSADVDGWDALYKLNILCRLAGQDVEIEDMQRSGLRDYAPGGLEAEVAEAARQGGSVKLVAKWSKSGQPGVGPVRLPCGHPLAEVNGALNAVSLDCNPAGRLVFSGPGAGGGPTASSVVGDVVHAVRWLVSR